MRCFSLFITVLILAYITAACAKSSDHTSHEAPSAPSTDVAAQPYAGPAFVLQSTSAGFVAKTSVPTGGHELIIDRTETTGDAVDIFATLVQPGIDELVTQVITTLEAKIDTGGKTVKSARLFVNLTIRSDTAKSADYRLAARWPSSATPP